jgi:hypothetical protein
MAVTMQQVRKALDPEEPDYADAAELGPDALPHLEKLVRQNDAMLSSKAAYLAALIPHARSADVVRLAAASGDAVVRVAAAAAARLLPGADAGSVLEPLLADHDEGVRKVALNSVQSDTHPSVRKAVEKMAKSEALSSLQDAAAQALSRLSGESRYPPAKAAGDSDNDGRGMGGGSMDGGMQNMQSDGEEPGAGRGGGSVSGRSAFAGAMAQSAIVEDSGGAGSGGGMGGSSETDLTSGIGQGGGSVRG